MRLPLRATLEHHRLGVVVQAALGNPPKRLKAFTWQRMKVAVSAFGTNPTQRARLQLNTVTNAHTWRVLPSANSKRKRQVRPRLLPRQRLEAHRRFHPPTTPQGTKELLQRAVPTLVASGLDLAQQHYAVLYATRQRLPQVGFEGFQQAGSLAALLRRGHSRRAQVLAQRISGDTHLRGHAANRLAFTQQLKHRSNGLSSQHVGRVTSRLGFLRKVNALLGMGRFYLGSTGSILLCLQQQQRIFAHCEMCGAAAGTSKDRDTSPIRGQLCISRSLRAAVLY